MISCPDYELGSLLVMEYKFTRRLIYRFSVHRP